MIGEQLGHFRILGKIGAGGMGEVFRARDEQLERDVALTLVGAAGVPDAKARANLLRDARAASKLNHPHICTIHEVGEADAQIFIATELVDGRPLSERLAEGPLRQDELLRYGLQLTDAVAYAHEHGVVHGGLTSSDVLVTPDGRVKVAGFGLARPLSREELTEARTMTQAPTGPGPAWEALAYLAPEQLRGQPAETRSDVWALGVLLQEMATGARPFQGETAFALSTAILSQTAPPLPSSAPVELQAIVERCLRKEPGQRYRRASDVHAALEAVQSGAVPPRARVARKAWFQQRRLGLAATAAVLLAVAAALYVGSLLGRRTAPAPAPAQTTHALAVLPLKNLSGDPNQQYVADGLTDALIDDLAKVVRVVSRTSTAGYATAPKPVKQIARELGVDAIVEGSVLREGNLVRVTAALIDAATEQRLWGERYERNLTSILALQADIARAVARAIKGALSPEEEQKFAKTREVNPAVWEAYQKGMFFVNQSTPEALTKGMEYLHEAVAVDPTDALAYAALADGYFTMAHGANPPPDALVRGRAAAKTAVDLDPTLPQAVLLQGWIQGYLEFDWDGGIATLRRVIELNPSSAWAYYHLAWFLDLKGQLPEAIAAHTTARDVDLLNPLMTAWLAILYTYTDQPERAIAEARKALDLAPGFPTAYFVMAETYAVQGRWDQAIEAVGNAAKGDPSWRWALGPMNARAGRTAEARRILAEMDKESATAYITFWLAATYAALGENDEAFKWIAHEPRHVWVSWMFTKDFQWVMQPVLSDPRYTELQRKFNVPDWRQ
jgi:eukaryotic-like serine/threonine-protein kinase